LVRGAGCSIGLKIAYIGTVYECPGRADGERKALLAENCGGVAREEMCVLARDADAGLFAVHRRLKTIERLNCATSLPTHGH
jgi:hypothetical protein